MSALNLNIFTRIYAETGCSIGIDGGQQCVMVETGPDIDGGVMELDLADTTRLIDALTQVRAVLWPSYGAEEPTERREVTPPHIPETGKSMTLDEYAQWHKHVEENLAEYEEAGRRHVQSMEDDVSFKERAYELAEQVTTISEREWLHGLGAFYGITECTRRGVEDWMRENYEELGSMAERIGQLSRQLETERMAREHENSHYKTVYDKWQSTKAQLDAVQKELDVTSGMLAMAEARINKMVSDMPYQVAKRIKRG